MNPGTLSAMLFYPSFFFFTFWFLKALVFSPETLMKDFDDKRERKFYEASYYFDYFMEIRMCSIFVITTFGLRSQKAISISNKRGRVMFFTESLFIKPNILSQNSPTINEIPKTTRNVSVKSYYQLSLENTFDSSTHFSLVPTRLTFTRILSNFFSRHKLPLKNHILITIYT